MSITRQAYAIVSLSWGDVIREGSEGGAERAQAARGLEEGEKGWRGWGWRGFHIDGGWDEVDEREIVYDIGDGSFKPPARTGETAESVWPHYLSLFWASTRTDLEAAACPSFSATL